jgi:hypothetical protein
VGSWFLCLRKWKGRLRSNSRNNLKNMKEKLHP